MSSCNLGFIGFREFMTFRVLLSSGFAIALFEICVWGTLEPTKGSWESRQTGGLQFPQRVHVDIQCIYIYIHICILGFRV